MESHRDGLIFFKMKVILVRVILFLILVLCTSTILTFGQDTIRTSFSFNYFKDLSDTFSGGSFLSGEFNVFKSWYGASIGYGHFQSHSSFSYQIFIEEDNQSFDIPFDELAIMQEESISGIIRPIQNNWMQFDIVLGLVFGTSKYSCFKSVSYTYNLNDQVLTSVEKDYQLVKQTHIGYQVGVNLTFYVFRKIGFQLSTRLQDLSNGGTFFFIGSGLSFRL